MKMETMMEEGEEYLNQEESWNYELDVSQLCRICANPNEYLIPIFHGEGLEHELNNKISKHLPIKILEEDKLPTQLCYQCASTLIAWHDMVVGCIEADEKLRSLFPDDKIEIDIPEVEHNDMEDCPAEVESNEVESTPPPKRIKIAKETEVQNVVQELQISPTIDPERIALEEEVTSVEPELTEEEVPSDTRDVIVIKSEDMPERFSVPTDEEILTAVEVYEDVETSVVEYDLVEGIEGQYIAYIGDEYVGSSVEIINQEMEENSETGDDSKPYVCEDCGRVFTNLTSFENHLTTHQIKGNFCNYCDASYKRIDHLQKHIEIMHPNSSCALAPKEKKINPYAKTFLCNTCGKILKSSIAYENHTLKHQSKCPYPCALCSETFPNRGARRRHEVKEHNLLTKENGNPDGYHVCEICGVEMFSDGAYYHHKDKHGEPSPCGFCGKLFGSRSLMQVHARRHTTERAFICTVCSRNFKVKQELNAHMNIHKDLRPYQCPHCPKMCRKSSDLTHHIRTHTGEKPFICDKCGRGFAQAGDMRKHRQLHFRPSKINKNIT